METISACPHHGFDTWMLVNHFYDGMSPPIKQLLETMCGGDFLNKHPDEAMDFLNYITETSKAWDEPSPREAERLKPLSHQKGVMYALPEDTEMKAKLSILTRRLDELEMKNQHKKHAASELSAYQPFCFNCQSNSHPEEHCLEHAHILNQNNSPINALYSNSYNTDWKNIQICHGSLDFLHMPLQEPSSSLALLQHNSSRFHFLLQLNKQS